MKNILKVSFLVFSAFISTSSFGMVVIQQLPKDKSKNVSMSQARQNGLKNGLKRSQEYFRDQKAEAEAIKNAPLPLDILSKIANEHGVALEMRSTCRLMNKHSKVPEKLMIAREFCYGERLWRSCYDEYCNFLASENIKKELLASKKFTENDFSSEAALRKAMHKAEDSVAIIDIRNYLFEFIEYNNMHYMPAIRLSIVMNDIDSLKRLLKNKNALDDIKPSDCNGIHADLLLLAIKNNSREAFEVLAEKNLFECKNIDGTISKPTMFDKVEQDGKSYKDHDKFMTILKKYGHKSSLHNEQNKNTNLFSYCTLF